MGIKGIKSNNYQLTQEEGWALGLFKKKSCVLTERFAILLIEQVILLLFSSLSNKVVQWKVGCCASYAESQQIRLDGQDLILRKWGHRRLFGSFCIDIDSRQILD